MDEPEYRRGDRITVTASRSGHPPIGSSGTVRSWNPNPVLRQLEIDWDEPARKPRLLDLLQGGIRVAVDRS